MPLHALPPDQRAVVQLILQRERSYAQIADLLSISEDAVRARAHAGLTALAPEVELPADKVAQISDFLLGQQNGKPRQATRRMLRGSNGARAWAEAVRAQLEDVGGALPTLPETKATPSAPDVAAPAEAPAAAAVTPDPPVDAEPPAPRPRPLREKPRTRSAAGPTVGAPSRTGAAAAASSRLGGAVLIGLALLAIVVVVLVLFVFNGDGDKPTGAAATAAPSATAGATATPQPVGQLTLKGTGAASKATGALAVYAQQKQLLFALQVKKMPPTPSGSKYALWFSGPGSKARWIGDVPKVGKNGVMQVQGPRQQDTTFTQDFATYRQILITRETGTARKRPGPTLVRGTLPRA
jgi:hypothetical protein